MGVSFQSRVFNIYQVILAKKKDKPRSHGGIIGWRVVGIRSSRSSSCQPSRRQSAGCR
nr:MAG TPA: hypothetical protein [Caudoviricetes sp.]